MRLITTPNLPAADDFYEALIHAHQGLATRDSHGLNAKLVLLLANHIGELPVLKEAIDAALANTRRSAQGVSPPGGAK